MKIPFHTYIGPLIKKHRKSAKCLCSSRLFCFSSIYTPILGGCGIVLSLIDLYRIVKCGSVLPPYLLKERKSAGIVAPEVERDLKLISLVLSLEYYLLVIVGCYMKSPVLLLPFLFLYAFIAFMELTNLTLRVMSRRINVTKTGLFVSALVAYNWFSVFCTFYQITCRCDY